MAKKLYEEANIQAIADAIREKNGLTETYQTSEMADAIRAIASGGSGTLGVIFPPVSGWSESKIYDLTSYSIGSCSFADDIFTGTAGYFQGAGMVSTLVDFSEANTLYVQFTASGEVDGNKGQFCLYVKTHTQDGEDVTVIDKVASWSERNAGTMYIDVSELSGEYYIVTGVAVWAGTDTASCTISKIRLE